MNVNIISLIISQVEDFAQKSEVGVIIIIGRQNSGAGSSQQAVRIALSPWGSKIIAESFAHERNAINAAFLAILTLRYFDWT